MSTSTPGSVDARYDHTSGSVIRSILRMGLSSMIGFAALNVYDVVDMFWVSRLGPRAWPRLPSSSRCTWVISSANMIAGTGSVAVISRRYGERDLPGAEAAIKEAIVLKLILALVCGMVSFPFLAKMLSLLRVCCRRRLSC